MKKFVLKIFYYLITLFFSLLFMILSINSSEDFKQYIKEDYLNGYINVLDSVKSNKHNEKIIFIGGSNLGFGLNTARLEKELGLKCYNFGVHGDIALEKIIFDLNKFISENDLIVISPEYINIENPKRYKYTTYYVDFLQGVKISDFINFKLIAPFLNFTKNNIIGYLKNRNREGFYDISWFNINGDVIGHHNKKNTPPHKTYKDFDIKKVESFSRFIDLNFANKNYIFTPPVTNEHRFNETQLFKLDSSFKSVFPNKYPISIYEMIFKNDCFFDSQYHLDKISKEKRTQIILNYLISNLE